MLTRKRLGAVFEDLERFIPPPGTYLGAGGEPSGAVVLLLHKRCKTRGLRASKTFFFFFVRLSLPTAINRCKAKAFASQLKHLIMGNRTMKKTLLILLLFITSTAQAERRTVKVVDRAPPRKALTDIGGHLLVESTGIVTLTKKGQRASYNVVGASEKGMLLLGLDTKADEGAFKVQLAKGAKIKFIEPQDQEDGKALTDVLGHLLIESTGIKTDVDGHLQVEATGIVTVWADSWPPPKTENDNEANVLIVKALNSGISSGKIKLKKPALTPEQRAGRAKRLLVLRCKLRWWFAGVFSPKEKPPTKSDR